MLSSTQNYRILTIGLLSLIILFLVATPTFAQMSSHERVITRAATKIREHLSPVLERYCKNACEIIATDVETSETFESEADMGFEGLTENSLETIHKVKKIIVTIQIDARISRANRNNLDQILRSRLTNWPENIHIKWLPIEIPQIGVPDGALDILKNQVIGRVSKSTHQVLNTYCPESCILSNVLVDGHLVSSDQALKIDDQLLVIDHSGHGFMVIDAISIELSIDNKMSVQARRQIMSVLKAKTKYYDKIQFFVETPEFPESYAKKQERLTNNSDDPYGLEKLRRMLVMFRDLAGTKEIISNSTQTNDSQINESSQSSSLSDSHRDGASDTGWLWAVLILLIVGGVIGLIGVRLLSAKQDAQLLTITQETGPHQNTNSSSNRLDGSIGKVGNEFWQQSDIDAIKKNYEKELLKRELTDLFIQNPKVAKETFSRLLLEEGVEETAKFVHLFGKVVVFELINDPSVQRRLYELSDYYHKSKFNFDFDEQLRLLNELKVRVTANEIRVLTTTTTDQFDFLTQLDPTQIFLLVKDESPQVQSIVMTQIAPKRRRVVFDMFTGQPKLILLKQLGAANAIPREYLTNVAKVLSKKVAAKPEFDTQNLRSSDILLDLLEKASLQEQQELMTNLMESNQDAARAIKTKLVTLEMLPYLKDGHLLELIMGLNQDDLTSFLGGCPEHIQKLLLSRAPQELAESWIEELEVIVSIDESTYQLVELAIQQKIRQLAANGAINILDINDMIFGTTLQTSQHSNHDESQLVDPNQIVA